MRTGGTAVTDRHDEENEITELPTSLPPVAGEGVRIIGAEEAQAALDSGAVARRFGEPESRFGDVAAAPGVEDEPTAEHPAVSGVGLDQPFDAHATQGMDVVGGETGEEQAMAPAPEGLPHWSEPATGEVPIILADVEPEDASDASAGLRYRTGATAGWTDEELDSFEGFEPEVNDDLDLSALATPPEDDDVAFDREVAARRVRTTPSPRPRAGARGANRDPDHIGNGADRPDMLVRVVTGLGMAVLALVCLSAGRDVTMVLATAIVGVCTFEFFSALHARGFRPATVIAILGSLTIVPLAYNRGEFAFAFTLPLVMVFTLLWFVFEVVHTRPMVNVAVTVGGFVYVGVIGGFAGLLLTYQNGVGLIIGVAVPVIAYDVFGYFVGSQLGKTRLAPAISPNKTVEGLIGGMTGSIIVSVLIVKQITPWGNLGDALALGITIAFMAPLGDLAESMLKRDLGIKDFGAILPGHGGMLDRFDALLFCMPAVYFLARALGVG